MVGVEPRSNVLAIAVRVLPDSTPSFVTARFRSQMTGMVGLPRANLVSEWE